MDGDGEEEEEKESEPFVLYIFEGNSKELFSRKLIKFEFKKIFTNKSKMCEREWERDIYEKR